MIFIKKLILTGLLVLSTMAFAAKITTTGKSWEKIEKENPFDIFSEFYELQNNQKMTTEQEEIMKNLIDEIWEMEL